MGSGLPSGPSRVSSFGQPCLTCFYQNGGRRHFPRSGFRSASATACVEWCLRRHYSSSPHVTDENEDWGVIVDAVAEEEDLLQFDGICNENALRFRRTETVEIMLAIDPDTAPDNAESSDDNKPEEICGAPELYLDIVDPLEPDVAEANDTAAQPTPIQDLELVTRGRAPPAWRRDDFPADGPVRRSVHAPPYSLRPPDTEPEV